MTLLTAGLQTPVDTGLSKDVSGATVAWVPLAPSIAHNRRNTSWSCSVVPVLTLTRTDALPAMTWASCSSGSAAKRSPESPIQADESTITKASTSLPTAAGSTSTVVRHLGELGHEAEAGGVVLDGHLALAGAARRARRDGAGEPPGVPYC